MRLQPLLVVFVLLASVVARAQPGAPAPDESRGERSSRDRIAPTVKVFTRETVVDVTVTDGGGNPVPPVAAFAPCPPRCALPQPSPSTEAPR